MTRVAKVSSIAAALLAACVTAAPAKASETCEAEAGGIAALIQARDDILRSSCARPIGLMKALFEPARTVKGPLEELQEERKAAVANIYTDELAAFRSLKQKHAEILARAKASGVLVPDDVAKLIGLPPEQRPAGLKYDLFGTPQSAMTFDKQEIALIKEIQGAYNRNYIAMEDEAKAYAKRVAEPIAAYNKRLTGQLDQIQDLVGGFDKTREELREVFFSGKFEHCLGEPDRSLAGGGSVAQARDGGPVTGVFKVVSGGANKTKFEDLPGVALAPPSADKIRKAFTLLPPAAEPKLPVDTAVFKRDGPSRIAASAEVAALQRDAERQLAFAETLSPIIKLGETTRAFGKALVDGIVDPIVDNVGGVFTGEKSLLEATGSLVKSFTIDAVEGTANAVLNLAKPLIDVVDASNRFIQNGSEDPFVKRVFGEGSRNLGNFASNLTAILNPLSAFTSDQALNPNFDPEPPGPDATPEEHLAFLNAIQDQRERIGEIREEIEGFNNVVNGAIEKLPDVATLVFTAQGLKQGKAFVDRQTAKVNDFLNGVNKGTRALQRLNDARQAGLRVQQLRQQGVDVPPDIAAFADEVAPLPDGSPSTGLGDSFFAEQPPTTPTPTPDAPASGGLGDSFFAEKPRAPEGDLPASFDIQKPKPEGDLPGSFEVNAPPNRVDVDTPQTPPPSPNANVVPPGTPRGRTFRDPETGQAVVNVNGQPVRIGERLGGGGFKEVFRNDGQPQAVVQAIKNTDVLGRPVTLEKKFRILEKERVSGDRFEKAGIGTTKDVPFEGPDGKPLLDENNQPVNVIVLDNGTVLKQSTLADVANQADNVIDRQGGKLTDDQFDAISDAANKANSEGFLLTDFKGENFTFKTDGDGRPGVEVLDKDGIVDLNEVLRERRAQAGPDGKLPNGDSPEVLDLFGVKVDLTNPADIRKAQSIFLDGPEACCPEANFATGANSNLVQAIAQEFATENYSVAATGFGLFKESAPRGRSFFSDKPGDVTKRLDDRQAKNLEDLGEDLAPKTDQANAFLESPDAKPKGKGGGGGAPPKQPADIAAALKVEGRQIIHDNPEVIGIKKEVEDFIDIDKSLDDLAAEYRAALARGERGPILDRLDQRANQAALNEVAEADPLPSQFQQQIDRKLRREILRPGQ